MKTLFYVMLLCLFVVVFTQSTNETTDGNTTITTGLPSTSTVATSTTTGSQSSEDGTVYSTTGPVPMKGYGDVGAIVVSVLVAAVFTGLVARDLYLRYLAKQGAPNPIY